jgi:hypothetical protein
MSAGAWVAAAAVAISLVGAFIQLVRKVERLETEIHNGVISRVTVIDARLDLIATTVAEMHGWMAANNGGARQ